MEMDQQLWKKRPLSDELIMYAAIDAYLRCEWVNSLSKGKENHPSKKYFPFQTVNNGTWCEQKNYIQDSKKDRFQILSETKFINKTTVCERMNTRTVLFATVRDLCSIVWHENVESSSIESTTNLYTFIFAYQSCFNLKNQAKMSSYVKNVVSLIIISKFFKVWCDRFTSYEIEISTTKFFFWIRLTYSKS